MEYVSVAPQSMGCVFCQAPHPNRVHATECIIKPMHFVGEKRVKIINFLNLKSISTDFLKTTEFSKLPLHAI